MLVDHLGGNAVISEQIKDVRHKSIFKGYYMCGGMKKKNKEEGSMVKKTSGHRVIIMADLSKMAFSLVHTPHSLILTLTISCTHLFCDIA